MQVQAQRSVRLLCALHLLTLFTTIILKLSLVLQVYKPTAVAYYVSYDSKVEYLYWIDSEHSIMRVRRDLTGRETLVTNLIQARDLVIDPIAG